MTRPSVLDSDGLPFVFDQFRLDGRVPSLAALIAADAAPPPVPPVPIDRSAHGRFRSRGLTDLDVVTLRAYLRPYAVSAAGGKDSLACASDR